MYAKNLPFSHYMPLPNETLVEIADAAGRPLCLVSPKTAQDQKLRHRAVATLAMDGANRLLLKKMPGGSLDVISFYPLPINYAADEWCQRQLEDLLGQSAPICRFSQISPCPETYGAIADLMAGIYSSAMLDALACDGYAKASWQDALLLAERDLLSPLLALVLKNGFLKNGALIRQRS